MHRNRGSEPPTGRILKSGGAGACRKTASVCRRKPWRRRFCTRLNHRARGSVTALHFQPISGAGRRGTGGEVVWIMDRLKLDVPTMKCGGCASTVEEALGNVPGISDVTVDLGAKSAEMVLGDQARVEDAVRAVEDAGHQATPG